MLYTCSLQVQNWTASKRCVPGLCKLDGKIVLQVKPTKVKLVAYYDSDEVLRTKNLADVNKQVKLMSQRKHLVMMRTEDVNSTY